MKNIKNKKDILNNTNLQECDCLNGQLHFLLLIINHKEDIDVTNNIHNKYYYDHNGNRVQ